MNYKDFRSCTGDIRISSTTGHAVIISKDFVAVPETLWPQAYLNGAISREMRVDSLNNYIADAAREKLEMESQERAKYRSILEVAFNDPSNYVDVNGNPSIKSLIPLFAPDLPKPAVVNEVWAIMLEEDKDTTTQVKRRGRPPLNKTEVV